MHALGLAARAACVPALRRQACAWSPVTFGTPSFCTRAPLNSYWCSHACRGQQPGRSSAVQAAALQLRPVFNPSTLPFPSGTWMKPANSMAGACICASYVQGWIIVRLVWQQPAAVLRFKCTALCRKLGCPEGRSAATWVDYSLFGHQIVCHHVKGYSAVASRNAGTSATPCQLWCTATPC